MNIQINGKMHEVDADPDTPLLWVIRDDLGMTGTKYGCGLAQCGACSVMVDDTVMRSCVVPVQAVAGRKITTIEAIEADEVGKRVVAAWVEHQVPQCGYCQSGQVVAVTSLLKKTPHPTPAQVEAAITNLCRCGTYNQIDAAVKALSGAEVRKSAEAGDATPGERS